MSTDLVRPEVGPPAPWAFPSPVSGRLGNGVRVVAFDVPGALLGAVTVLVRAPLDAEPADREGVATIVANTLDEGTAHHSGEQFSDEVALLGAQYGAAAGRGTTQLSLDVASSSLQPALALLAEALTSPTFPEQEVARHVALRLAAIAQQDSVAAIRAGRGLAAACFAATSRASRPGGGTPQTVAPITAQDVTTWYRAGFSPNRTTVVLGADLAGADPVQLVGAALADWTGDRPATLPDAGPAPQPTAPTVTVIDRPGSVQSALALGLAGPDRGDPAWPALLLAAHALGGGLSSRLMQSLREDLGYTYGIGARFSPFRAGGQFAISTAVDTATTGPALDQIRLVVDGLRRDGLTAPERDDAVDYYLGASPLRFQTARALVDQAAGLLADAMPADWLNSLRAAMPDVSAEQASTAFADAVPAPLAVVVVGDADTVAEPVAALGLGTPSVVPADQT